MKTRQSKELQIGKAGEYLTCADIIINGMICFPSEQGLPYDLIIDTGNKLLKCQVKTTLGPRRIPQREKENYAYIFNIKRHGNSKNIKIYHNNEVDVFALCCLDTKQVGYVLNTDMPTTVNFRVDSFRGKYYDEKGIQDYKKVVKLFETIKNKSEIARILGIGQATASRYLQYGYKPHKTKARYFSDIIRNAEWFQKI